MALGIDVSNNNGTVNWAKAAADGITFAWAKATEGLTFNDGYFLPDLHNARAAGIAVGAYHFARPDEGHSPESEASHFLNVYRAFPGDLLPVLDFETSASLSPAAMTAWAKRWMELVEAGLHVEAILYTYPYFLRDKMDVAALKGRKLWYADYTGHAGKFAYKGFTTGMNIVAQQYSSHEHVAEVNGKVDGNYAAALAPILQSKPPAKPKPMTKRKPSSRLPGPTPKPGWFWKAVKKFIAGRSK